MQDNPDFWKWLREKSKQNQESELIENQLHIEMPSIRLPLSKGDDSSNTESSRIDFEVDFDVPLT